MEAKKTPQGVAQLLIDTLKNLPVSHAPETAGALLINEANALTFKLGLLLLQSEAEEAQRLRAEVRDLRETHAAELITIGERLGFVGLEVETCGKLTGKASNRCLRRLNHDGDCDCQTLVDTAPTAEQITERVQQLLTDLQNTQRAADHLAVSLNELVTSRDQRLGARKYDVTVPGEARDGSDGRYARARVALRLVQAVRHRAIHALLQEAAADRDEALQLLKECLERSPERRSNWRTRVEQWIGKVRS